MRVYTEDQWSSIHVVPLLVSNFLSPFFSRSLVIILGSAYHLWRIFESSMVISQINGRAADGRISLSA